MYSNLLTFKVAINLNEYQEKFRQLKYRRRGEGRGEGKEGGRKGEMEEGQWGKRRRDGERRKGRRRGRGKGEMEERRGDKKNSGEFNNYCIFYKDGVEDILSYII